jgi:Ras-related protein Rab-2A
MCVMSQELIKGILYSQFHAKAGPKAIAWVPLHLPPRTRELVSTKSINLLAGEHDKVPETLAIIPFPSLDLKGIVKYLEVKDSSHRGNAYDCSLTLLFDEANDLIFYKYIKDFEAVFSEATKDIQKLEEKKADHKKFEDELIKFQKKVQDILDELRDHELTSQESAAFPDISEDKEAALRAHKWKIIVCGDPSVGKTSTILRYTNNAFRKTYLPTIGTNLSMKQIKYRDLDIKFTIWDVAGQAKFQTMRRTFYQGADGEVLVFDLTDPKSLESIPKWHADIQSHLKDDIRGVILGNKNDLQDQRKISREQGEKIAKQLDFKYYETSALTGENIQEVFEKMAELVYTAKYKDSK